MCVQGEYELIAYPRLHHVKVDTVDIFSRNLHLHRELELCHVLDGTAEVQLSGGGFPAPRGASFFFNSNQPHAIRAQGASGVRIACIQVANNFCQDYLNLFRGLELQACDLRGCLSAAQEIELAQAILRVVADDQSRDPLAQLRCLGDVCLLFSMLLNWVPYRLLDESEARARGKKAARLRRITEYIDAHSTGKISLAELARSEGVTLSYLSHFIRDNLNMSFQDYVNNLRFQRALKLIADPGMRLVDVCIESGFSDVKYLNRMFERRCGCTPGEYRNSLAHG